MEEEEESPDSVFQEETVRSEGICFTTAHRHMVAVDYRLTEMIVGVRVMCVYACAQS